MSGSTGSSAGGGNNYTAGSTIAVNSLGNAYVDGETNDTDFPTTAGAEQTSNRGIDDGFVSELAADGSALVFSTYLGGSDYDGLFGLVLEPDGNVLVDGYSSSSNMSQSKPFQSAFGGITDAWLAEISGDGKQLLRSDFLGGSGQEQANSLAIWNGTIYVTGVTPSTDFPVTPAAPQAQYGGGVGDAFLTIVSATNPTAARVRSFTVHRRPAAHSGSRLRNGIRVGRG